MKRQLSHKFILLALFNGLMTGLVACGNGSKSSSSSPAPKPTQSQVKAVAIARNGIEYYTYDFQTWESQPISSAAPFNSNLINATPQHVNKRWFLVAQQDIGSTTLGLTLTSADGINWESIDTKAGTLPLVGGSQFAYANNTYYYLNSTTLTSGNTIYLSSSPDGITWTAQPTPTGLDTSLVASNLTYLNGIFTIYSLNHQNPAATSLVYTSNDLTTFINVPSVLINPNDENIFTAVQTASSGTTAVTPIANRNNIIFQTGTSLSNVSPTYPAGSLAFPLGVAYGGGKYLLALNDNNNSQVVITYQARLNMDNQITSGSWELIPMPSPNYITWVKGLAYNQDTNKFYMATQDGSIYSYDGVKWALTVKLPLDMTNPNNTISRFTGL